MNHVERDASEAPASPAGGLPQDRRELERVLDALPLGMFVVDHARRLTRLNDAFLRQTGLHRAAALGRTCRQVLQCTYCGDVCPSEAARATGAVHCGMPVDLVGPGAWRGRVAVDATPLSEGSVVLWMREVAAAPVPAREQAVGAGAPGADARSRADLPSGREEQVRRALQRAAGSPTLAARLLGVHRSTLWRWMAERGLRRSDFLPS